MLILLKFSFLLVTILHIILASHKERNILFGEFKDKRDTIKDIEVWRTKLRDDFNSNLKKMPESVKKTIISYADKELKTNWDPILAMNYLGYKLEGKRTEYEGTRRSRLQGFILAEMLTNSGKYIKEIANGVWLMLEESTWVWPAHMSLQSAGLGLPDPKQYVIDLGVGEAAAYISWVKFLVGDKLNKISPIFVKRIDYELDLRLVQSFLKNDYWWTGLKGQKVNNWNVWINSNIIITALLNLNDPQRLDVTNRSVVSVDDWLNWYGDDGGCDEGPAYWGEAGGRFIQYLYYLSSVSNNKMSWSSNELINNIGAYIYKMHINSNYFVNFADSSANLNLDPTVVYGYGEALNDNIMKEFAAYWYQLGGKDWRLGHFAKSGHFHEFYLQMTAYNVMRDLPAKAPQPLDSWLPELQVVTLRSKKGSGKGLFLGAKGGTNDESHNHNDIGNFVIYVDGLPAIIDIGVGTYNSKTFSSKRYELWNMQSQWHNCPTINGVQQKDGPSYKASDVKYTKLKSGAEFVVDIASAYPKNAQVKSWIRKFSFDRKTGTIQLTESYELVKFVKAFETNFITILDVKYDKKKKQMVFKNQNTTLLMNYKTDIFEIKTGAKKVDDTRISKIWGDRIQWLTLVSKLSTLKGEHTFAFHL